MILEQKPVFAKTCRFFLLDCLRFLSKHLQAKQAIEKPVRTLCKAGSKIAFLKSREV